MFRPQKLLLYLMICLGMLLYSFSRAEVLEGKVVNVYDGNTFQLETKEKEKFLIKLYGVDAPDSGQRYHEQATNFLNELIFKKKVIVQIRGKDRKGIRLGEVQLKKGELVNKVMINSGMGWAEPRYSKGEFSGLEIIAKEQKVGLWKEPDPTPPWIFRRQQSMKMAKSR